jgi:hypothetical protein
MGVEEPVAKPRKGARIVLLTFLFALVCVTGVGVYVGQNRPEPPDVLGALANREITERRTSYAMTTMSSIGDVLTISDTATVPDISVAEAKKLLKSEYGSPDWTWKGIAAYHKNKWVAGRNTSDSIAIYQKKGGVEISSVRKANRVDYVRYWLQKLRGR